MKASFRPILRGAWRRIARLYVVEQRRVEQRCTHGAVWALNPLTWVDTPDVTGPQVSGFSKYMSLNDLTTFLRYRKVVIQVLRTQAETPTRERFPK